MSDESYFEDGPPPDDAPIDIPGTTIDMGSAIVETGVSGLGPGTAPATLTSPAQPTKVPKPEVSVHTSGLDPSITFQYDVGADGKLYGKADRASMPDGPRRHLRVKATHSRFGWHAVAMIDDGRLYRCMGSSGAPSDSLPEGEAKRITEVQRRANEVIIDPSASKEAVSQAMHDWSHAEQQKLDRDKQFLPHDARTAIRQALVQLQIHHCLYEVGAAEEQAAADRRRLLIAAGAAVVVVAIGLVAVALRGGGDDSSATLAATKATTTTVTTVATTATTATSTTAAVSTPTTASTPNRPPTVSGIHATFARPTTSYDVAAEDPDGDPLTFTWTKDQAVPCGVFSSDANAADWTHPDKDLTPPGDCPSEPVHPATISVTVDDGHGHRVTATYANGSAPGEGAPPAG